MKKKVDANKVIIFVLTCSFIMLFGLSYAWYHMSLESKKDIILTSGSLQLVFSEVDEDVINLENAEPMSDEDGLETNSYRFSIKNTGSIDSNFTLYLDDLNLDSGQVRMDDQYIKYVLFREEDQYTIELLNSHEKFTTDNGVVSRSIGMGTISVGETQNYILKVWIADTAPNSVMNTFFRTGLRVEAMQKLKNDTSNFVRAYTYSENSSDSNYCITGNEETCQMTSCYKDKAVGSCPSGTIIQYRVNDADIVSFHVMFDEGGGYYNDAKSKKYSL